MLMGLEKLFQQLSQNLPKTYQGINIIDNFSGEKARRQAF